MRADNGIAFAGAAALAALGLFAAPVLHAAALPLAAPAALGLFAAPTLHAAPGLLSAAIATAPEVITAATFPLLLAAPWFNAIFTLAAPLLFAGPASIAPGVVAALSVAPFLQAAATAALFPVADPLAATLLKTIALTFNIGWFAPAILFAALPLVVPAIQIELWAGPVVAFLTSALFPIAARTAAVATTGLHGATIAANKIIQ
ncbi:unnamed protein product [Callosobruchus maculatus]|uniref:Uncharacterized protein n=1 Tax=Callosobruchus maculatus TaxID=64391 RepID=A0A653DD17_CALMS|nr:unnamed protein product [Callosobruchus maculatus]